MLYKFDTESVEHAKCALLLYALYKSRDKNSPLNGVETWERFNTFVRGACLKVPICGRLCRIFAARRRSRV